MALIRRVEGRGRRTLVSQMDRLKAAMPGAADLQDDRDLLWRGFREVVWTFLEDIPEIDLDALIRLQDGQDVWHLFGATLLDDMLPWIWREYLRPLQQGRVLWAMSPGKSSVFMFPKDKAEEYAVSAVRDRPENGNKPAVLEGRWTIEVLLQAEYFTALHGVMALTSWYGEARPRPVLMGYTLLEARDAAEAWQKRTAKRRALTGVDWD
jgi:hypothetical protein